MRVNSSCRAAEDATPEQLVPHFRELCEHLNYVTEVRTGASNAANGWLARDLVLLGWRRTEEPFRHDDQIEVVRQ